MTEQERLQIDAYLQGKMSGEEHAEFEANIQENPELAETIHWLQRMDSELPLAFVQRELDQIHLEVEKRPGSPTRWLGKNRVWLAAASVFLFLGVGLWWWIDSRPGVEQKLFQEYYQTDSGLPTLMGESSGRFDHGMTYFKQGEIQRAKGIWLSLKETLSENDTLNLYLGLTYLEVGKIDSSIHFLERINPDIAPFLSAKRHWYLALSYVINGQPSKALTQLQHLDSLKDHPYAESIKPLTRQLREMSDGSLENSSDHPRSKSPTRDDEK